MSQQTVPTGSGRLILLFKSAYWIALSIIAAMALASYLLLQQMMAAQQRDEALSGTGQCPKGAFPAGGFPGGSRRHRALR